MGPLTCEHCGYDLTGLVTADRSHTCPECGHRARDLVHGGRWGLWLGLACGPTYAAAATAACAGFGPGPWLGITYLVGLVTGVVMPCIASALFRSRYPRGNRVELKSGGIQSTGWMFNFFAVFAGAIAGLASR